MSERRRLVIGVGNTDRGDDGAGRVVAQRLRSRNAGALEVRECTGEAAALMDAWTGFDEVVLVDACRGDGEPGSIHRFAPDDLDRLSAARPRRYASTHGFGVVEAVALARALGNLPSGLVVYAIEGGRFRDGAGLSPAVDHAVQQLVALLAR